MTHLSPHELVAAVEGTLGRDERAHVEECAACREEVARLVRTLRDTQQAAVPEPSPLFWTHFSQRVHDRIAAEDAPRRAWASRWLRAPVLVPVCALALLVFALVASIPRGGDEPAARFAVNPAETVDDLASLGEREWSVLSEIVGPFDLDAAQDAGFMRLGDAERAASQLSAPEQRELLRLLQEEMGKVGG